MRPRAVVVGNLQGASAVAEADLSRRTVRIAHKAKLAHRFANWAGPGALCFWRSRQTLEAQGL
jgi:hypothetical protein